MPLKNAEGILRGFAKIMRDDTKEKLAEEKIVQTNQPVENILSSIDDSFYTFDSEFRFVHVNEATTKMFGLSETDFFGKNIVGIFPNVAGNNFHREISGAFNKQQTVVFENYYPPRIRWFENLKQ